MEENNKNDQNRQNKSSIDYASLVSSAAGAVAGVVGASSIQSAMAADIVEPEPLPDPDPRPTPNPKPEPDPKPEPGPIVTVDENVTVVYSETVDMGGGHMADIAIGVTPDGNEVAFVDVDQDDIIDFKMSDIDSNGEITENEVIDVQSQNIHMDDLMRQADELAQLPDYNSEANVDEFLA